MIRFAFTFLLLVLIAGCQTAAHAPHRTGIAHLFQPRSHDTSIRTAEAEGTFVDNHIDSNIMPVRQTAHASYHPGDISLASTLSAQESEIEFSVAETTASIITANPPQQQAQQLQIQSGDSEAFRRLLREIAVESPEKRRVDDERLAEMLTTFRNDIMHSEVEDEYLALLRRRVLPEIATPEVTVPRSAAPLPDALLADRHSTNHHSRGHGVFDNSVDREPLVHERPNRLEAVVAQAPIDLSRPAFPHITQIPGVEPSIAVGMPTAGMLTAGVPTAGVAQVAYHHQVPRNQGFGAGDWQAHAREAAVQLQFAIEQTPHGRTLSNEMRLRLLETVLGNQMEAARPMQEADDAINRFMSHQVLGFAALLDDTTRDNRIKYTSAAYRFSEALQEMQSHAAISLKTVLFVNDWFGFGQFAPRRPEFHPGERFRVYMEVENPSMHLHPIEGVYEVAATIRYEIRNSRTAELIVEREDRQSYRMITRKRDHVKEVAGVIPPGTPPGDYQLSIRIIDLHDASKRSAEEQIPFRVVQSTRGDF